MDGGAWQAAVHGVARSQIWLSDFTLFFHFHALEKEIATHSSVLVWRIPGTGEPGGLPSMGSHRVGHDWSDLAAAAAYVEIRTCLLYDIHLAINGDHPFTYLTNIYWVKKNSMWQRVGLVGMRSEWTCGMREVCQSPKWTCPAGSRIYVIGSEGWFRSHQYPLCMRLFRKIMGGVTNNDDRGEPIKQQ